MKSYNVYIGFDERESIAYSVCDFSIKRRSSSLVDVKPLKHRDLRKAGIFRRPWLTESTTGNRIDLIDNKPFSTEFSHTRFLVPELNSFKGWALFMDCDMIFQDDIRKLFELRDDKYAVMVVKHNHRPKERIKMDDQPQSEYPKKNWSSFILWNCAHPSNRQLTAPYVNMALGSELHNFGWLKEWEIGSLPFNYNWIEGVTPASTQPSVIHYTLGGPWFSNCMEVMYADKWLDEYKAMIKSSEGVVSEIL
jgi:lipopolysaccharide biosynthesis glycosyltransferase